MPPLMSTSTQEKEAPTVPGPSLSAANPVVRAGAMVGSRDQALVTAADMREVWGLAEDRAVGVATGTETMIATDGRTGALQLRIIPARTRPATTALTKRRLPGEPGPPVGVAQALPVRMTMFPSPSRSQLHSARSGPFEGRCGTKRCKSGELEAFVVPTL